MEIVYQTELEDALASANPVNELREFAQRLNKKGLKRQEIYDTFYKLYQKYQEEAKDDKADVLGDVMDMITGYYVPFTLDLD